MKGGVQGEFGRRVVAAPGLGDTFTGAPAHPTAGPGDEPALSEWHQDEVMVGDELIRTADAPSHEYTTEVAVLPDPNKTDGHPMSWRGEGILPLIGHTAALAAYRKQHPKSPVPKRYQHFID
jgi:hypothetical protein